jgi:hypothetical protein
MNSGTFEYTLGGRISFARQKIKEWCLESGLLHKTKKAVKKGLCCPEVISEKNMAEEENNAVDDGGELILFLLV